MLKLNINDPDKKIFQTEIFNQLHPIVMRKMDALRLKSFGLENSLICQILKIHPNQKKRAAAIFGHITFSPNSRGKKWHKLAIEKSLLKTVRKENKDELKTLLNLKFQLFKNNNL